MAFNLALKSKTAEASVSLPYSSMVRFLDVSGNIVPRKTSIRILQGVRISFKGNSCIVCASDSYNFVDMTLSNVSGHGEMDLVVEYAPLKELLGKITSSGMLLIEREGNILTFKCNATVCGKLTGTDGMEFPSLLIPPSSLERKISLSKFEFGYVRKYVSTWCVDDKEYTALDSVLVEADKVSCGFVATDRHTLVFTKYVENPEKRYAMPAVAFKTLQSLDMDCTLSLYESYYRFEAGVYCVYGRLNGGKYPDFHALKFHGDFSHEYSVDVGIVRNELKRLLAGANLNNREFYPVVLQYGPTTLEVIEYTDDYTFNNSCIKVDAVRLLKVLERFDDNSCVKFKSSDSLNRPMVWSDSHAISLSTAMI